MSPSVVVLFEDRAVADLWPLAAARPAWDLRLGGHTLADKLRGHFHDAQFTYVGRPEVIAAHAEDEGPQPHPSSIRIKGDVVWLNGRALADERWLDVVREASGPTRFWHGPHVVALAHPAGKLADVLARGLHDGSPNESAGPGWTDVELEAPFVHHPWDLLRHHHHELMIEGEMAVREAHAAELAPRPNPALAPGSHVLAPHAVAIHPTARIAPGCVLDGGAGPIVVERDAVLEPFTHVVGPCWIGAGTHVLGGKLGGGVSLGPVCRVAGEIEETIFQGFGNKRHHGFVGHSVVGAWTNLGALTTTSDLKNNYGGVRVTVRGQAHETGESKVGSFLGDHVKTGIGTLLTTGAVVGPASNLFGGGTLSPRELPAFAWWDGAACAAYDVERFVVTARTVCARRGRTFGPAQERLFRSLAAGHHG